MSRRSQEGGCAGGEEDDDNIDKVNGDGFKGDVLLWHAVTLNGAALTLECCNWYVGRGVITW